MNHDLAIDHLSRKLASRRKLGNAELAEIRGLPFIVRTLEASSYLVREGDVPKRCSFILSGFAYRQKLTNIGTRQIVSLHVPGDFVDLQNLFLKVSDHNVQTLTRATVADVPIPALRALALRMPQIGMAMWIDALIDASLFREWLLNVGRRDARARLAHLICECAVRLKAAGIADDDGYELPMTQEQLADALGLTPVHVNRVLKGLASEGLIARSGRRLRLIDWPRLSAAADFNERYLHLDQAVEINRAEPVQAE